MDVEKRIVPIGAWVYVYLVRSPTLSELMAQKMKKPDSSGFSSFLNLRFELKQSEDGILFGIIVFRVP